MIFSAKICKLTLLSCLTLILSSHPNSEGKESLISNALSNFQVEFLYGEGLNVLRSELRSKYFPNAKKNAPLREAVINFLDVVSCRISDLSTFMNNVEVALRHFQDFPDIQAILDKSESSDDQIMKEIFMNYFFTGSNQELLFNRMQRFLQEIRILEAETDQKVKLLVGNDDINHQKCLAGHPSAQEELLKAMPNSEGIDRLIVGKGLDSLIKDFVRKVQILIESDDGLPNEIEAKFRRETSRIFYDYKKVILSAVEKIEGFLQGSALNPKFLNRYLDELDESEAQWRLASGADKHDALTKANSIYKNFNEIILNLKDSWNNFKEGKAYNTVEFLKTEKKSENQ